MHVLQIDTGTCVSMHMAKAVGLLGENQTSINPQIFKQGYWNVSIILNRPNLLKIFDFCK